MKQLLRKARKKFFPGWNDEWPLLVEKAGACKALQLGSGMGTDLPGIVNADINVSTNPDVGFDLSAEPLLMVMSYD